MGGKASGVLGIVIMLLGMLLIIAAVRGTYIPVWRALSSPTSPAGAVANANSVGSVLGKATSGQTAVN